MNREATDTEHRRLEALRMMHEPPDPARLDALLADEDWRVRKQAAEAAARSLKVAGVIPMLVAGLVQPDDVGLRNAALEAFLSMDAADADAVFAALREALAVAPATARKFVVAALVGVGREAIELIAPVALEPDVMTASSAIEALTSIALRGADHARIAAILERALARTEPVLRLAALDGLLALEAPVELSVVEPLLGDPLCAGATLRLLARSPTRPSEDGGDAVTCRLIRWLPSAPNFVDATLVLARRLESLEGAATNRAMIASSYQHLAAAFASLDEASVARLAEALASSPPEDARRLAHVALVVKERRLLPSIVALGARIELDPRARLALFRWGPELVPELLRIARDRIDDDVLGASWAIEALSDRASLPHPGSGEDVTLVTPELRELARRVVEGGVERAALSACAILGRWGDASDAAMLASWSSAYGSTYEGAAAAAIEEIASRSDATRLSEVPERVGRRPISTQRLGRVRDLRAALAEDDAELRARGLDEVQAIATEDDLELVTLALTDGDERVESAALRALQRLRDPALVRLGIDAARVASRSARAAVRAEAIETLSALGAFSPSSPPRPGSAPAGSTDVLLGALADTDAQVVIAALRALRWVPSSPTLDAALDARLISAEAEILKEALGVLPGERATERAVAALEHAHWSVRARAAEVLGLTLAEPLTVSASIPGGAREAARAALTSRRAVETDELVLKALTVALGGAAPGGAGPGGAGPEGVG